MYDILNSKLKTKNPKAYQKEIDLREELQFSKIGTL